MRKKISGNTMLAMDFKQAKRKKDSIYSDIIKWDEAKRFNIIKKKSLKKRRRTIGDIIRENHNFTDQVNEIGLGEMNTRKDNLNTTQNMSKFLSSLRNSSQQNLHQDL